MIGNFVAYKRNSHMPPLPLAGEGWGEGSQSVEPRALTLALSRKRERGQSLRAASGACLFFADVEIAGQRHCAASHG